MPRKNRLGVFTKNDENNLMKKQLVLSCDPTQSLEIGTALSEGDCLFDSIAQVLNYKFGVDDFSAASLREIIQLYLTQKDDPAWVRNLITNDKRDYKNYKARIVYTANQITHPIWGRADLEGRILCENFDLKIHLIEVRDQHNDPEGNLTIPMLTHHLVTKDGETEIEDASKIDYTDPQMIHIVNDSNSLHFVPMLPKEALAQERSHSSDPKSKIEKQREIERENRRLLFSYDQKSTMSFAPGHYLALYQELYNEDGLKTLHPIINDQGLESLEILINKLEQDKSMLKDEALKIRDLVTELSLDAYFSKQSGTLAGCLTAINKILKMKHEKSLTYFPSMRALESSPVSRLNPREFVNLLEDQDEKRAARFLLKGLLENNTPFLERCLAFAPQYVRESGENQPFIYALREAATRYYFMMTPEEFNPVSYQALKLLYPKTFEYMLTDVDSLSKRYAGYDRRQAEIQAVRQFIVTFRGTYSEFNARHCLNDPFLRDLFLRAIDKQAIEQSQKPRQNAFHVI